MTVKIDLRKLKWDSCGDNVRFFYGGKVVHVPEEHIESVKLIAVKEYRDKLKEILDIRSL